MKYIHPTIAQRLVNAQIHVNRAVALASTPVTKERKAKILNESVLALQKMAAFIQGLTEVKP